ASEEGVLLRGGALPFSPPADGQIIHYTNEVHLLYSSCAVGRLCERAAASPPSIRSALEMDRLLNFTAGMSLLLIVLVLASVRRAHIRVEYSVSWLVASLAILGLSRSPSILEAIAARLGITYPPLALMLLAGCVFVVIFYRFSVIISKLKDDNIA